MANDIEAILLIGASSRNELTFRRRLATVLDHKDVPSVHACGGFGAALMRLKDLAPDAVIITNGTCQAESDLISGCEKMCEHVFSLGKKVNVIVDTTIANSAAIAAALRARGLAPYDGEYALAFPDLMRPPPQVARPPRKRASKKSRKM